ncbi:FUSC family protein [Bacillus timonensis]|uniref:FUSC family protein n=1 Tax=Bacillus timonensis TaxID=1033734 RepID=UPI000287FBC0|nr:FUSC family protein [Bacillus timonensis]
MSSSIVKDAFKINRTPFPMRRAIGAAISSSVPIIIGILLGHFQYGLLAGIGGFSYLYVFNDPYKHRAKKVFFVMLGLATSMGLGTLTADSPFLFALILGLIGGIGTFIFGALKIRGPASIFFVIIFAMTSAMEIDPNAALQRASFVFFGGVVSWIVAMIGWFSDPYKPEKKVIHRIYVELTKLAGAIGTSQFDEMKESTLFSLREVETTLSSGYISWRSSDSFKRLYILKDISHFIWGDILEIESRGKTKIAPEILDLLKQITQALPKKSLMNEIEVPDVTLEGIERNLFNKIVGVVDVIQEYVPVDDQEIPFIKHSVAKQFLDAFDKNSLVFLTSLRYAVVLGISAIIAFSFNFERSYWIPVSCGSVMLGSTIISTFHRSIQRSIGTLVGIFVAGIILSLGPAPIIVALLIAIFNFFTESLMVRNYALAVSFITPNAILIAESTTRLNDLPYFAAARITDVVIGCIIGIVGVLFVGRQTASSRIPHLMSKTIRSQAQLFYKIFSSNSATIDDRHLKNKMRTNLNNLRTVYGAALGEIPNNIASLSLLSPVLFSMEQLGYFLEAGARNHTLTKGEIGQFLYIFETIAQSVEQHHLLENFNIPEIPNHARIQEQIDTLLEALITYLKKRNHRDGSCGSFMSNNSD